MKNVQLTQQWERESYASNQATSSKKVRWMIKFVLLFTLFFTSFIIEGAAQCSIFCNGTTQDNALPLSVDNMCQSTILASSVIDLSSTDCVGGKELTVRDLMNNQIAEDIDQVTFDASTYIGDIISVTVTDTATGLFCVSFVEIIDNLPPSIDCQSAMVKCVADTSAAALGLPTVTDNCGNGVDLSYSDVVDPQPCFAPNTVVVNRIWTATDASNNLSTCSQTILIDRPNLNEIDFPDGLVLDCDNANVGLDVTGQPTIEDGIIENSGFCDLTVTFVDDTVFTCGTIEYEIVREWTVMDDCSNQTAVSNQTITVTDQTAPEIVCPDAFTVETLPGQCYTTVDIPFPNVTDNCDANATFMVSTSYGAVGLGPHPFVPVGTHSIQYTGVDFCGNAVVCTTTVNVVDDEEPTAVCSDFTAVSVPSTGVAVVAAQTFDDGSNDNCAMDLYFKVRRTDIGGCDNVNGDDSDQDGFQEWFDDLVVFCCEEATGPNVQVLMRVYEIDPGNGPIDPVRQEPGGDLFGHYTECMVQVTVQDMINPVFAECPDDLTITCTDDISDLSIFGVAHVVDNCSFTLDSTEVIDISSCGQGTITRTFTAIDPSDNETNCVQTITVVNDDPFSEENITWPENITLETCGVGTDPDDLPEGMQEPEILDDACSMVAYNYDDHLFDIAFPACYKILRTWTVIDWCRYDPNDPNSEGRFSDVQIIKVEDNDAPVMDCPDDIVAAVSTNCNTANVSMEALTANDCNPDILFTNDSPYADVGGADISGEYPLGETLVSVTASDKCGNTTSCEIMVTVEDLTAPSAICIVGISASLVEMNGEVMAMIDATAFDGGSHDNCSADEDLELRIRVAGDEPSDEAPTTSQLTFTCEDVGSQLIEFWVIDEKGNGDYCTTYILVQDNQQLCPAGTASGMVAGSIETEMGETVEDVMVHINAPGNNEIMTNADGTFEFLDIPFGYDYSVIPEKDDYVVNGVNTLDMIKVQRHILGIQDLGSPYKMIAADVDGSGNISILDLVHIRKLILNVTEEFPNNTASWKFIPTDYNFSDPNDPFADDYPEASNIDNFSSSAMYKDFIAVKMGDVDNTATPNSLFVPENDQDDANSLVISTDNQYLAAGEELEVPFRVSDLQNFNGYQFTMNVDIDQVEIIALKEGDLPEMTAENFGEGLQDGWITTSWNARPDTELNDETRIFTLLIRAKTDIELANVITLNSSITDAEAYNEVDQTNQINLDIQSSVTSTTAVAQEGYELYQNTPNPFRDETTIAFDLAEAGYAKLTIYDAAGNELYNKAGNYMAGKNSIMIQRSDLAGSGIVYYKLQTANFQATKKMIIIK